MINQAIASMRSPRDMKIICVDVTNRCDLQCSNCTRLLANQRKRWDMTPENWRTALRSLAGFPGIIAMIGGNPCLHPKFPELCRIFVEEIPERGQRGLWSNNVFKHQAVIAETFGIFNLNPHGDKRGIQSLLKLREHIPNVPFFEGASHHAPLMTAIRDLILDEDEMWKTIAQCDINRNWSASIVQNNGKLRAYFCEVAASFDLARGEDHGTEVVPGWWNRLITDFRDQVKHFCPGCGAAARLAGRLDSEDTDDYTFSNADIATNTRGRRKVKLMTESVKSAYAVTDYADEQRAAKQVSVSIIIPTFNAAETIRETIDSIASQAVPENMDVEIIIADDGSTDATGPIASEEKRVPVRILWTLSNAGPAAARNRGLQASRADYVMFLDADDCLAPGALSIAQYLSDNREIAAVVTDVELVDAHREVQPAQLDAMVWSMPSNMMVRRSVADLLGGFPDDAAFRGPRACEDMIFKRALVGMFRVAWIRHPLVRYRVRRGSHFDLFLDNTAVANGQMQFLRDSDKAVDAATDAYLARATRRIEEVRASSVQPDHGTVHVVMMTPSQ